jgi:hypothetical protein
MSLSDGRLVVNEFESLETRYETMNGDFGANIQSKLKDYWKGVLHKLFHGDSFKD